MNPLWSSKLQVVLSRKTGQKWVEIFHEMWNLKKGLGHGLETEWEDEDQPHK